MVSEMDIKQKQQYDRQMRVIGEDAMRSLTQSNILVVGLTGLGVEIAKNLILMGVNSVTLHDDNNVEWRDLSSQFYFKESSVGKNRVKECIAELSSLNEFVKVLEHSGDLSEDFLKQFKVVVFADASIPKLISINQICRRNGVKFIATESRGVFGALFVDFGEGFNVSVLDSEDPAEGVIVFISNAVEGQVDVNDGSENPERHNLADGDLVVITGVEGMDELKEEENKVRKVKVTGQYTFTIGDTSHYKPYIRGGYFKQIKQGKTIHFASLADNLANPRLMDPYDFAKFDNNNQLHIAFQALAQFIDLRRSQSVDAGSERSYLPRPRNEQDATEFIRIAAKIHNSLPVDHPCKSSDLNTQLMRTFAYTCAGQLNPMAAYLGGIAAQEVQKACTSKFHPINQWLYFDAIEALPTQQPPTEEECQPRNCRYDGQIAVFGAVFQHRIENLKYFLVGAGALGCEYLKNFAMMGLGCGDDGKVIVTDMDSIELSNLSRQFLFRNEHVGKMKSEIAAYAAKAMNPSLNVVSLKDRVGQETESTFDDKFWEELDGVANALDNVPARLYVDSRCVYYRKPLIESGTLGTKGNVQVVVPHLTESYGSTRDPEEKSFPACTIHSFPSTIQHTIIWAKNLFATFFTTDPQEVNKFFSNPKAFIDNEQSNIEVVHEYLTNKPNTFDDCIAWARRTFDSLFNAQIVKLLAQHPIDSVTSTGAPFWSGSKKPPSVIKFDAEDPLHMDFIIAAAILHAQNYGLLANINDKSSLISAERVKQVLSTIIVPDVVVAPSSKPPVATLTPDEQRAAAEEEAAKAEAQRVHLKSSLENIASSGSVVTMYPAEFEKDDDTNYHMAFITAASNLRARNYKIPEADFHTTKGIAGKIIPAMVTTTALVTGLACFEIYKVIQLYDDGDGDGDDNATSATSTTTTTTSTYGGGDKLITKKLSQFKNAFVNIALPLVMFSEPIAATSRSLKFAGRDWTLWDRIEVDLGRDITLGELLEFFEREYKCQLDFLTCGTTTLYSFMLEDTFKEKRKAAPVSKLVSGLQKCTFLPNQQYLQLSARGEDMESGEDVTLPPIRYRFSHPKKKPVLIRKKKKHATATSTTSATSIATPMITDRWEIN